MVDSVKTLENSSYGMESTSLKCPRRVGGLGLAFWFKVLQYAWRIASHLILRTWSRYEVAWSS